MVYVTNHWIYNHWMMKDMPTYDWFHQFPGFKQTNFKSTTHSDTNASETDKNLATSGWFVKSMPDLNQKNPLVLNYLIQNAIWWIESVSYTHLDVYKRQGFGGMRVKNDTLHFEPKIPSQWQGYSFKINFRNQILKVEVQQNETKFSLEGSIEITVFVNGKEVLVEPNSLVTV